MISSNLALGANADVLMKKIRKSTTNEALAFADVALQISFMLDIFVVIRSTL